MCVHHFRHQISRICAHGRKKVGMRKGSKQRLSAATRESGHHTVFTILPHPELPFHEWHDFFRQLCREVGIHICRTCRRRIRSAVKRHVTIWHHNEHFCRLSFGNEPVGNDVCPPHLEPCLFRVGRPAYQIKHRVVFPLRRIITSRRIDQQRTESLHPLRIIRDVAHLAAGNIGLRHVERILGRHHQQAGLETFVGKRERIRRVGNLHAVHHERIGINVRRRDIHRDAPHSILPFHHRATSLHELSTQFHVLCARSRQTESHLAARFRHRRHHGIVPPARLAAFTAVSGLTESYGREACHGRHGNAAQRMLHLFSDNCSLHSTPTIPIYI